MSSSMKNRRIRHNALTALLAEVLLLLLGRVELW